MGRKKGIFVCIALLSFFTLYFVIYINTREQIVKCEMPICTTNGETAFLTIDVVLENDLFTPRQYKGSLYFNETQYIAHQNANGGKLSAIISRFIEKLNHVTYAIFFRAGVYGISSNVIIEDMIYSEEDETFIIWLWHREVESIEYFGPASNIEEARRIKGMFHEFYSNGN